MNTGLQNQAIALKVNPKHYGECTVQRGLDAEWILANSKSVTAQQASELLGYSAKSAGLWLEGANFQGQFKPDKPWKSENDKKAAKYRSPSGDEYDVMLPRHPSDPHYWEDLEALKPKCYQIDSYPCLIVPEGFFKAIAGCSNDIPSVAIMGVEMGLTPTKADLQGKRYLVPGLEKFARAGFGFIHAFDADCATKPEVLQAQRKLCYQIAKFKVPQYIATGLWKVDEGKGMDDYIQNNGADKFRREVLASSVPWEQWEKQFKNSEDEKKVISQSSLSKEIAGDYRIKLMWHVKNKAWYWYEFVKKGIWSEIPEEEANAIIIAEIEKRTQHFKFDFVSSVAKFLKSELRANLWEVRKGFVCLEDCVIDVATGKEYPHEPGYRFLSSLPYKWSDRTVGCEPIKQWLLDVCEGRAEWVQVLRGAMKATVTERGGDLQRFMELIGFGGTGKGTIIRLVTALVGKENIAVTDLKQLEKNRFETAAIYGKKAVIITDSERYAGDVSILKALTGDDIVRQEKKGVQQTEGFKFKGMVWIAANEAIQSADYTSGLKRRRLSMPFDRVVPPHLRRDLETEFQPYLAGLFAWVLEMPDAEVDKYVGDTDKTVRSLASFNAEILLDTNPIASWADTCLVFDPKAKTYVGNKSMSAESFLFPSYCNWAEAAGYSPVAQSRFSRNLLDLLKSQLGITEASKGKDNKGAYITGISIRHPGLETYPLLITGDGQVTLCDGKSDGSVMGQVTGKTLASEGFSQSDAILVNPNPSPHHLSLEEDGVRDEAKLEIYPSHPSNPSLTSVSAKSLPITEDPQTRHSGSISEQNLSPGQLMTDNWQNKSSLGEIVLKLTEVELTSAIAGFDEKQVQDIKDAANSVWRPGFNRDADYNGERVEIIQADQGREITVKTLKGSLHKVKRGNLRPWLNL